MAQKQPTNLLSFAENAATGGVSRRKFFGLAGGVVGASLLLNACRGADNNFIAPSGDDVALGSGDVGILNYAFALEQLEAAFYTRVIEQAYTNMSGIERAYLTDIRDHEVAHREFFKAALSDLAIPELKFNFESIDFGNRSSVLNTAKAFEDLGVSAYNGAGKLIVNADYLLMAGKIVSVEARHAALIRDLIQNGTFADTDIISLQGLDDFKTPAAVLNIAKKYIVNTLDASNLPQQ